MDLQDEYYLESVMYDDLIMTDDEQQELIYSERYIEDLTNQLLDK